MNDFQLDSNAVRHSLRRAAEIARTAHVDTVVGRARRGRGIDPEDMAILWFAESVDTEAMYELAREVRRAHPQPLETFSPLYMTNTCDAECRMCGMRRDNPALTRRTADLDEVKEQLRLLLARGMHAVALLTGEYSGSRRAWAMQYANRALKATQALEFAHVLVNVGSAADVELEALLAGVPRKADGSVLPKLTMCTFQETYCRETYARFMGTDPDNPRADFERRLTNFDRAHRAGLRVANPGILVGLNPDLPYEITALALHARHLLDRNMEVYLSVPRLRQIAGGRSKGGVRDEDFIRVVSLLSLGLPACKIVITTRESPAIQRKLISIVAVLSAGSAAVAPYTRTSAHFPLEASQFEVIDQRPFEDVLRDHGRPGSGIVNYQPSHATSARS